MIYGAAQVSTDSQTAAAQVCGVAQVGCKKVLRGVASGAKTDRSQLRRALDRMRLHGARAGSY
jgi:hypothetical protein